MGNEREIDLGKLSDNVLKESYNTRMLNPAAAMMLRMFFGFAIIAGPLVLDVQIRSLIVSVLVTILLSSGAVMAARIIKIRNLTRTCESLYAGFGFGSAKGMVDGLMSVQPKSYSSELETRRTPSGNLKRSVQ